MIGPKVVAGDTPAFAGVPETGVTLVHVRRYPGSQADILQYAVGAS